MKSSRKIKYAVQLRKERVDGLDSDRPYIGLENIESNTGRLVASVLPNESSFNELTQKGESLCNLFEPNDILFGKLRPYLAKTWVAEFSGRCTTEALTMIPNHADPSFIKYNFLSNELLDLINGSAYGSKMPRADWDFIGNQFIFFPSLETQRRIATFLDRETTQIDALIAAKERLLLLLAEKRQALITRAVTRGLDPAVKMMDSGVEWLGEVPEHWEVKTVKHLGRIYYGLSQPPEYQSEGLPLIRATNIFTGEIRKEGLVFINENDLPQSKKVVLETGDIIVVRSGAYTADSAIVTEEWKGSIAGFDMVFRANKSISPFFLAYALLSPYVLNFQLIPMSARAAQPHLNAEELGSTVIVMPQSLKEQSQITAYVLSQTKRIDSVRNKIQRSITLLKERRSALISAAVTGQITIPD